MRGCIDGKNLIMRRRERIKNIRGLFSLKIFKPFSFEIQLNLCQRATSVRKILLSRSRYGYLRFAAYVYFMSIICIHILYLSVHEVQITENYLSFSFGNFYFDKFSTTNARENINPAKSKIMLFIRNNIEVSDGRPVFMASWVVIIYH